jgi:hypothetical protein
VSARRVAFGGALFALVLLAASGLAARDVALEGWFDLEVRGGEPALAVLGFSLDERAFTLPLMARTMFDRDLRVSAIDARLAKTLAELTANEIAASDVITIPAPLDRAAWEHLLPPVKPPASRDLFIRIVSDRTALLVAYGLTSTTDRARVFFSRERDLLRSIYQQAAGTFALVARRLDVVDGKVVVPGGPGAEAVWTNLVGVPPSRPGQFLRALLTKDQGRLAWYFDVIAGLDADRLTVAWPSGGSATLHAMALYQAFREPDPQWRTPDQPFRRGAIDAWMVLTQNRVSGGAVQSPLPQATWALLFSDSQPSAEQIGRSLAEATSPVSLAWLARETLSPIVRERRSRYEMFRLAQRVFADAPAAALPHVAQAVAGVRQFRGLLLTLERMEIRDPATWAAVLQAARFVNDDADSRRESIIVFQSIVALLERMRHVRTVDVPETERLLRSLAAAMIADENVPRSAARWIVNEWVQALPRLIRPDAYTTTTAYESTILQALAGPAVRAPSSVDWEGLSYVADIVAAEHARLLDVRALLPSPGLDAVLNPLRPRELGQALMALVYAPALGDPDGPVSLSPDVATRHDFGMNATALLRDELPWSVPEERQGYGPWHVQGSLFGLDLALSRLFLRRIADQQMPSAPSLTLNDVATLSRTGVAMVASELVDADRDELAAAIGRGRQRVEHAQTITDYLTLAAECGMSATTRQLLVWMASRQREIVPEVFALRDLLWLGRPNVTHDILDRWGVAADGLDGRRVLAMPAPAPWEDYAGRSEVGQMTTQVPDLTLRLIEETAQLRLPASLVPSLLAFALEDYWHEVRARFADDWPRLTWHAAAIADVRIHDYVAALAGGGPLRAQ